MGELILVTGGARSGKSTFAQSLACAGGKVVYLATLDPQDDEMKSRVQRHRMNRDASWRTVEESLRPSSALRSLGEFGGTVILECLTLLVTNIILSAMEHGEEDPSVLERAVLGEVDAILSAVAESRFRLIAVTNEVGLGLVPDNRVGRIFRDIAGLANQRMASAASSVHLVISGIPVQIKG